MRAIEFRGGKKQISSEATPKEKTYYFDALNTDKSNERPLIRFGTDVVECAPKPTPGPPGLRSAVLCISFKLPYSDGLQASIIYLAKDGSWSLLQWNSTFQSLEAP